MNVTPSPQPSDGATKQMTKPASEQVTANPTGGEGVESQNIISELSLPIRDANLETDQTHDEVFQSPPLPLRERVGERGC